QALGCDALGLTGADANIILSHKRSPLAVDGLPVDFGFVQTIQFPFDEALYHELLKEKTVSSR
ncbi:MAG: hypothetical protein IIT44_08035, partial [Erysipelotrichaceae bacterium]|nr:hypothetical protein [Erysipelotrichaceae bacterium]